MITLEFVNQAGYRDVSVTQKNKNTFVPELGWANPDPLFASVIFRNIGFFPLRLKNQWGRAITGPSRATDPGRFVTSPFSPIPAIKDFVRVTIMDQNDNVIRTTILSVPFAGLLKSDVVRLDQDETVFAHLNYCLVDKSGIPNRGMGAIYFVQVEIGWDNSYPDWYANLIVPARFYSNQIRHSQDLDIL